jgi:peptidoglycan/xylan/chitin deacetylase (PgdA/CDA1 family)
MTAAKPLVAKTADNDDLQPWQWPEARWRAVSGKIRPGRSLKPKAWKNGARVAVGISFDSDHESGELRDGGKSLGRMSMGQYGARAGIPRIMKLLEKHSIPASFFTPAVVALLYPEEQKRAVDAGHEVGIHGWIHELNSVLPGEAERDLMFRSCDVLEKVTGVRPVGIRTPSWDFSPNTLAIIREMGLLYDSSLMADDDPYELNEDGKPTGVVELPPEWIRDDAVYFNMHRFTGLRPYTPPSAVLEIFTKEFDVAYEEGGMYILTMHPHVIGHRSRLPLLDELIRHMKTKKAVWFATHADIARYCRDHAG